MAAGAALYVSGALADYAEWVWIVPGVLGPHEIFHLSVLSALALHGRFVHAWAAPGALPDARPGMELASPTGVEPVLPP